MRQKWFMKDNSVYLNHILEAIAKIEKYIKGFDYDSFESDDKTIDAVVRELEIVGEAAKHVSDSLKDEHPEIPWSKMMGIRNRLIHEYFGVNKKIIWETCETDLPALKKLITSL